MAWTAVPMSSERRRAWAVIFALAAALASSASFGVDHQFTSTHSTWQACSAASKMCSGEPVRPAAVWVFAVVAAVSVACALVLWVRTIAFRPAVRPPDATGPYTVTA